jgi:hypothetical protein
LTINEELKNGKLFEPHFLRDIVDFCRRRTFVLALGLLEIKMATEALKVALRVLTAVSEGRESDAADVETLKSYFPMLADAPTDELACAVIVQQIKLRAAVRSRASGGGMTH